MQIFSCGRRYWLRSFRIQSGNTCYQRLLSPELGEYIYLYLNISFHLQNRAADMPYWILQAQPKNRKSKYKPGQVNTRHQHLDAPTLCSHHPKKTSICRLLPENVQRGYRIFRNCRQENYIFTLFFVCCYFGWCSYYWLFFFFFFVGRCSWFVLLLPLPHSLRDIPIGRWIHRWGISMSPCYWPVLRRDDT